MREIFYPGHFGTDPRIACALPHEVLSSYTESINISDHHLRCGVGVEFEFSKMGENIRDIPLKLCKSSDPINILDPR